MKDTYPLSLQNPDVEEQMQKLLKMARFGYDGYWQDKGASEYQFPFYDGTLSPKAAQAQPYALPPLPDWYKEKEQAAAEVKPEEKNGYWENIGRGMADRSAELAGNLTSLYAKTMIGATESAANAINYFGGGEQGYSWVNAARDHMQRGFEAINDAGKYLRELDFGYIPQHTWEELKQTFGDDDAGLAMRLKTLAGFIAEQGLTSLPDIVAASGSGGVMAAYWATRSHEIGEERAKNNGYEYSTLSDTAAAAPYAAASIATERVGNQALGRAFRGKGGSIAAAMTKEGAQEAVQESIEYAGETVGTERGFNVHEMADRAAAGAVAGAGMGGTVAALGKAKSAYDNRKQNGNQDNSAPEENEPPHNPNGGGSASSNSLHDLQHLTDAEIEAVAAINPADAEALRNLRDMAGEALDAHLAEDMGKIAADLLRRYRSIFANHKINENNALTNYKQPLEGELLGRHELPYHAPIEAPESRAMVVRGEEYPALRRLPYRGTEANAEAASASEHAGGMLHANGQNFYLPAYEEAAAEAPALPDALSDEAQRSASGRNHPAAGTEAREGYDVAPYNAPLEGELLGRREIPYQAPQEVKDVALNGRVVPNRLKRLAAPEIDPNAHYGGTMRRGGWDYYLPTYEEEAAEKSVTDEALTANHQQAATNEPAALPYQPRARRTPPTRRLSAPPTRPDVFYLPHEEAATEAEENSTPLLPHKPRSEKFHTPRQRTRPATPDVFHLPYEEETMAEPEQNPPPLLPYSPRSEKFHTPRQRPRPATPDVFYLPHEQNEAALQNEEKTQAEQALNPEEAFEAALNDFVAEMDFKHPVFAKNSIRKWLKEKGAVDENGHGLSRVLEGKIPPSVFSPDFFSIRKAFVEKINAFIQEQKENLENGKGGSRRTHYSDNKSGEIRQQPAFTTNHTDSQNKSQVPAAQNVHEEDLLSHLKEDKRLKGLLAAEDVDAKAVAEKLKQAKVVELTGNEIPHNPDLKQYRKNALEYGKSLRGSYVNKDTGKTINLHARGVLEILQHDYRNPEQLQSIAAIPQLIEESIYLTRRNNEDVNKNPDVKGYEYYLGNLKIQDDNYVVRSVVAVSNEGGRYYDHKLSEIKKHENSKETEKETEKKALPKEGVSSIQNNQQEFIQNDISEDISENIQDDIQEENENLFFEEEIEEENEALTEIIRSENVGAKTQFKNNIAAIELLRKLQAIKRQATPEEQEILARWKGWGGLAQAFPHADGSVARGWQKEAQQLRALLSDEEYAAARESTLSAYYTPPEVIQVMWEALKHMGFKGGRVLEPSLGAGDFLKFAPKKAEFYGVELEPITGGIAQQLYPNANIQIMDFADYTYPDDYFKVVIGNPPFGDIPVYDGKNPEFNGLNLHHYFMAKSIDALEPEGVMAMLVSSHFLESKKSQVREYISKKAELIAAFRLPNNLFNHTQVTTDLIFFRKTHEPPKPNFIQHSYLPARDENIPVNEYFAANPRHLLGNWGRHGNMYQADGLSLKPLAGLDLIEELRGQIKKALPKGIIPTTSAKRKLKTEIFTSIGNTSVYSFFEYKGNIYQRMPDLMGQTQGVKVNDRKDLPVIKSFIHLRDTLDALMLAQLNDADNIELLRAALNRTYDDFVAQHGALNKHTNLKEDPSWWRVSALVHNKKKAAIFTQRTQYKKPNLNIASAKDALLHSWEHRGHVDMPYMQSIYSGNLIQELKGLIYRNPLNPNSWLSADEYLAGSYMRDKLRQAEEAAILNPEFEENVNALKLVQPLDIEALDIDVALGSSWVPASIYKDFLVELGARFMHTNALHFNKVHNKWNARPFYVTPDSEALYRSSKRKASEIMMAAINQTTLKEYYEVEENGEKRKILDEEATQENSRQIKLIEEKWADWLWLDDARRRQLERIYNERFNHTVLRKYDGSHLNLLGMNPEIELRPTQKNAIWRILQDNNTLLDHTVGAGKTFTIVGAVMELRRLGLSQKPLIVVPNHLTEQWASDFMHLYPQANILVPDKTKDFSKGGRKKFVARVVHGDWDAIIIAQSTFKKIGIGKKSAEFLIKEEINQAEELLESVKNNEHDSLSAKQIASHIAKLKTKLAGFIKDESKDQDNVLWDELGIDALFIDEAHHYKNLNYTSTMHNIRGLGNPNGSQMAIDLFYKIQLMKRFPHYRLVFATGTPISNSIVEMHALMRYLNLEALTDAELNHFDAWARLFGRVQNDFELTEMGNYQQRARFSQFVSLPELMQFYGTFADRVSQRDLIESFAAQGKRFPVPNIKGGKPQNIVVKRSSAQAELIGIPLRDEKGELIYDMRGNETYRVTSLLHRINNLPQGQAQKGGDNILKIISEARQIALDPRLIEPTVADFEGSKVNVAAQKIADIAQTWEAERGTQLIFIDLSTPKSARPAELERLLELKSQAEKGDEQALEAWENGGAAELEALQSGRDFSLYDDLKNKLIALGMPSAEIAFIHEAKTDKQKAALFDQVNRGEVRVLLGSTGKMGAGTNVQKRLVAVHHLDVPWRPSDLEQRNGRIVRQGNALYESDPENFAVEILYYATEQTMDASQWQLIESKSRAIEQLRSSEFKERSLKEEESEAAQAAAMKAAASGNPLILEEIKARKEVENLQAEQRQHQRLQIQKRDAIATLQRQLREHTTKLNNINALLAQKWGNVIRSERHAYDLKRDKGLPKALAEDFFQSVQALKKSQRATLLSWGEHYQVSASRDGKGRLFLELHPANQASTRFAFEVTRIKTPATLFSDLLKAQRDLKVEANQTHIAIEEGAAALMRLNEQAEEKWAKAEVLAAKKKEHETLLKRLTPAQALDGDEVFDDVGGALGIKPAAFDFQAERQLLIKHFGEALASRFVLVGGNAKAWRGRYNSATQKIFLRPALFRPLIRDGKEILSREDDFLATAWHELLHHSASVVGRESLEALYARVAAEPELKRLAQDIQTRYGERGKVIGDKMALEEVLANIAGAMHTRDPYGYLHNRFGDNATLKRLFEPNIWQRAQALAKRFIVVLKRVLQQLFPNLKADAPIFERENVLYWVKDLLRYAHYEAGSNALGNAFDLNTAPDSEFARAVDDFVAGQEIKTTISLGTTPDVLRMLGFTEAEVKIKRITLSKVLQDKHRIKPERLKRLPEQLNEPVAVLRSLPTSTNPDGYVVLTELTEFNRETKKSEPVIVALHLMRSGDVQLIEVASAYGKSAFALSNMLKESQVLYWDTKKGKQLESVHWLQLPLKLRSTASLQVAKIKTKEDLSQYLAEKLSAFTPMPSLDEVKREAHETANRLGGRKAWEAWGKPFGNYHYWIQANTRAVQNWLKRPATLADLEQLNQTEKSADALLEELDLYDLDLNRDDIRAPKSLLQKIKEKFNTPELKDEWLDNQGELERLAEKHPAFMPVRHAFKAYNAKVQHELEKKLLPLQEAMTAEISRALNQFKSLPIYRDLKEKEALHLLIEHLDLIGKYVFHGRERNAWIAIKSKGKDLAGSGKNNEEISALTQLFNSAEYGNGSLIEYYSGFYQNHLKKIIEFSDDYLAQNGLLTPEMKAQRPHFNWYVPLYGKPQLEDETVNQNIDDAFQARSASTLLKNKTHAAEGRRGTEAKNILENVVTQAEISIRRAQFQEPKKRLFESLQIPEIKAVLNARTVELSMTARDVFTDENAEISWKNSSSNAADAIVWQNGHAIQVMHIGNPHALKAFKDFNRANRSFVGVATRFMGSMYTRFNPAFIFKNKVMDSLSQWTYLLADAPIGEAESAYGGALKNLAARLPLALKALKYNLKWTGSAWAKGSDFHGWRERYAAQGGITSMVQFLGRERLKGIEQMAWEAAHGRGAARATVELFNDLNNYFEETTRVSAFRALVELGVAEETAAHYVKDIMNFETKGDAARQLGNYYAFFTTTLYDARRKMKALTTKEGQLLLALMTAFYASLHAMIAAATGDDERGVAWVDAYNMGTASRNVIVPLPSDDGQARGEAIRIPTGFGLNQIANTIALSLRRWHNGTDDAGEALSNLLNHVALRGFAPIQPSDVDASKKPASWLMHTFSPTTIKPLFQFAANENWHGGEIYKDERYRGRGELDYNSGALWTPAAYRGLAQKLYDASGFDVAPESLQFFAENYLGGMARTSAQITELFNDYSGSASWWQNLPVASAFTQNAPQAARREYQQQREQVYERANRAFDAIKRGHNPKLYADDLRINEIFRAHDKALNQLRKYQKQGREKLSGEELKRFERRMMDAQNKIFMKALAHGEKR